MRSSILSPARLAFPLAPVLLLAALGCRNLSQPPTGPEAEPAPDLATAGALSFRQVSAGETHTCGVTLDDRAYCWGSNSNGKLGDGSTMFRPRPVAVAELRFLQVSAGRLHTCGVTTANRAYCWGANLLGGLGDGTATDRLTPVAVLGGHRFRTISVGGYHTCATTTGNVGYCWGRNYDGQLGDDSTHNRRHRPVPIAGDLRFRRVTAGGDHSCGVTTDDRAYCWGEGRDGQIGDGTRYYQRRTPTAVAGGLAFRQVVAGGLHSMGGSHSCGVTRNDRAYCWGANDRGQLGNGTTTRRVKPAAVAGGHRFSEVNPGGDHTCGVTTAEVAYCWGSNYYGQLGDGNRGDDAPIRRPVAVGGGLLFASVNTGRTHPAG